MREQTVAYRTGAPNTRAAFTLVELLVVIGILGLLAALIFPTLRRAKGAGRAASCINHLRQLGAAAMTYSVDNNGRLPFFLAWLHAPSSSSDLRTGALFPYLKTKPVYFCPSDRIIPAQTIGGLSSFSGGRDYSYSMNCGLCHQTDPTHFVAPTRTFLFVENTLVDDDFSGVAGPVSIGGVPASAISRRHDGSGCVAFCDSHVEKIGSRTSSRLVRSKRSWLPNDTDDLGIGASLPDP
jgi:prepilin-type N-terminal cleavage/methylation domain-containing protein/prepilin-type processing-associated H-X9-DG protein